MKKALITGITGQDGSYLAELLLEKGYDVHGTVRRSSSFNTGRIDHIYSDPHNKKVRLHLHYSDLSDSSNLSRILEKIKPDEIYHLGAQSHVRVSFDTPEYTADVTGIGTLRLLDAIRETGIKTKFYQASSSEMFGKVRAVPQNEETPFYPRSQYGVAKVFAYWITKNYRESYGLYACNGILFNHECLTAQTPVIIKKHDLIDIVAIEEAVPHRENPRHGIKYTTIGNNNFEIWDGNQWTTVKTLTATWNAAGTARDKKVKKVICRGGYYEATADHVSFLAGERSIPTKDIRPGDQLTLKSLPSLTEKTVMTVEEAEFLGMMVADGYISAEGKGRFINNDMVLRHRLIDLWQKVSGGTYRESSHPSGFRPSHDVQSIELTGNRAYLRMLREELYSKKSYKKIPVRVLNSKAELAVAFLRGYNSCDGLKAGGQKTEYKSYTTNSSVLALGLWYLTDRALGLRLTLHPEQRSEHFYYHLNVNAPDVSQKGKHLQREISEVKEVQDYAYSGWLFDLETDSGTFSAGIGLTWVHNSPRRGETFVTRKITRGLARIHHGKDKYLYLGNLDAKRDWGYAKDYVEAMWLMLQQETPEDYVIATHKTHSVRQFVEEAAKHLGIEIEWRGSGIHEEGINKTTGKTIIKIDKNYFRPAEVDLLIGDYSKAKKNLGWTPKTTFKELVKMMIDADMEHEARSDTSQ